MKNKLFILFLLTTNILLAAPQMDSLYYTCIIWSRDTLFQENANFKLNLEFPSFSDHAINKPVRAFIFKNIFTSDTLTSKETLWKECVEEYATVNNSLPGYSTGWIIDKNVKVIYNKNKIVSLRFYEMRYTGGAHPNTIINFNNYNVTDNSAITLSQLFSNENIKILTSVAETIFKKLKDIDDRTDLSDAGFHFPDNTFALNENFAFTEQGLLFYYNPYEIAAYAKGPTELIIPWENLQEIAKVNSILRNLFY